MSGARFVIKENLTIKQANPLASRTEQVSIKRPQAKSAALAAVQADLDRAPLGTALITVMLARLEKARFWQGQLRALFADQDVTCRLKAMPAASAAVQANMGQVTVKLPQVTVPIAPQDFSMILKANLFASRAVMLPTVLKEGHSRAFCVRPARPVLLPAIFPAKDLLQKNRSV
jgi:hypothetical protein